MNELEAFKNKVTVENVGDSELPKIIIKFEKELDAKANEILETTNQFFDDCVKISFLA